MPIGSVFSVNITKTWFPTGTFDAAKSLESLFENEVHCILVVDECIMYIYGT